jgi:hypothetical protein
LAPRTDAIESSSLLLPTPTSSTGGDGQRPDGFRRLLKPEIDRLLMTPTRAPWGVGGSGSEPMMQLVRLLPTPTAQYDARNSTHVRDANDNGHSGTTLLDAALVSSGADTRPRSEDGKSSSAGLRLSHWFVEWMMGAPDGWSDPDCRLSATEFSSRQAG